MSTTRFVDIFSFSLVNGCLSGYHGYHGYVTPHLLEMAKKTFAGPKAATVSSLLILSASSFPLETVSIEN